MKFKFYVTTNKFSLQDNNRLKIRILNFYHSIDLKKKNFQLYFIKRVPNSKGDTYSIRAKNKLNLRRI